MVERLDFNDSEYTQARLEHYLRKEVLEEAVKKAQAIITEIKMNGIHQKARAYAVCEAIIEFVEELDEAERGEERRRTLVAASNERLLGEPDLFDKLHHARSDRYSRKWTDKLHSDMYRQEHPPRTGWGPHRNMTLEGYREQIFRPAARKYINSKLSLAEEENTIFEQLDLL